MGGVLLILRPSMVLLPRPNKAAYVAAKHGLVGLTKVAALENADRGITCNAICPGWVLTPLVQKQIDAIAEKNGISNDDARIQLLSEKEPTLDFTTPEDIGEMVAFLCTDAARNITGSAYTMDGGVVGAVGFLSVISKNMFPNIIIDVPIIKYGCNADKPSITSIIIDIGGDK